MTATDKAFTGSIPEVYERCLVPLIFEPYAQDMAERVMRIGASQVLVTAAGTGVVTRAIAAVLPASARIVASDLNEAMLDIAMSSLAHDSRIVLPMRDGNRSLNLSNAVAVVIYEAWRQLGYAS